MRDHSIARAADDSTLKSSASGADSGSGSALFEPGVGKKCFASSFCCAVVSYAKSTCQFCGLRSSGKRTLNATRPTRMPATKKQKAMRSQMTPHTFAKLY